MLNSGIVRSISMKKKRIRQPGIFFRPEKEELEKLANYGREHGLTMSFVALELFRCGFAQWRAGNFKPTPTAVAQRMFANSKTARRV